MATKVTTKKTTKRAPATSHKAVVIAPEPEPEPEQKIEILSEVEENVIQPEVASGSESDKDKSSKKLNAYQQFVNETVNKLKVVPDHAGKKYMELRALANIEWRVLHPVTDDGKLKRQYKKKEKTVDSDSDVPVDDEVGTTTKKKTKKDKKEKNKEPREKREPTAYNIFVKTVFAEINEEFKDKESKPSQREKMKLAADRWREVKAAAN